MRNKFLKVQTKKESHNDELLSKALRDHLESECVEKRRLQPGGPSLLKGREDEEEPVKNTKREWPVQ